MSDQIRTVPLAILDVEPVAPFEPSRAVQVADLACAAIERWARVEGTKRPFSCAWLATSFIADCQREPWLGDWWHLYQTIAERHHAALIAARDAVTRRG